MMTKLNKFKGYDRAFPSFPSYKYKSAPEFDFLSYDEFINSRDIQSILSDTPAAHGFKMLRQPRAWIGSDGKVSKTFYTVIL